MRELNAKEVEQVSGGFGFVGAAIGGAVGAVGGFFVGVYGASFGNGTQSVSSTMRGIGMTALNGAWAGATIGSGVGVAGSIGSAVGGLLVNEFADTTDE